MEENNNENDLNVLLTDFKISDLQLTVIIK